MIKHDRVDTLLENFLNRVLVVLDQNIFHNVVELHRFVVEQSGIELALVVCGQYLCHYILFVRI